MKKTTNRSGRASLALAAALSAWLLVPVAGGPAQAAEIVVGAELALTGPYAFAGAPSRDGLMVAIEEINADKLAGEHSIKLMLEDTASDKQQAIALVNRFALRDNAVLILGPSSSLEGTAIAPVANAQKIPLLTTTAVADDITKSGPWAFRTPASPATVIGAVAKYAVEKAKVQKAAFVFARDNEGQIGQKNVARDYMRDHGVKVVAEESVLTSDNDFMALLTKLQSLDIDAVYLTLVAEQGANFIIQARQSGIDPKVKFFGTPTMGSDRFTKVGGKAVEGATFVADYFQGVDTPQNQRFVAAFKAKYNRLPDNWAALGYAAMHVAARAIKDAGPAPDREKVRAALAGLKDATVILGNGRFAFDADRNPNYGALVLTVKNGQFTLAP